jgi:hypothetical protein
LDHFVQPHFRWKSPCRAETLLKEQGKHQEVEQLCRGTLQLKKQKKGIAVGILRAEYIGMELGLFL